MNVQPVIRRELQGASRRRETWRLRLYFGGSALAAALFGLLLPDISNPERGMAVLISMTVCGFALTVFAGAYVTADAVCSEKREGTLGLLFLTPLNGWEIILGKMAMHSLQVQYAVLGGFPLFFLPVMIGGVLWSEVARVLLVLLLTMFLSLACGVFWSAAVADARTAVLATAVTMLVLTLLPWLWVFIHGLVGGALQLLGPPQISPMTALVLGFETNYRHYWGFGPKGPAATTGPILYWSSVSWLLACSAGLLGVSGWLLPRVWRRSETETRGPVSPAAPAQQSHRPGLLPWWVRRRKTAPLVWQAARELRQALWLRVVRLGIAALFGVMLLLSLTTRFWEAGFTFAFCSAYGLHLLTRIEFALSATRRLHEEWRNGALEIMLTTPIAADELVRAHHESLKRAFRGRQFLLLMTNALLLSAVVLFPQQLRMGGKEWVLFGVFCAGGAAITLADFAMLRWLGLREALRSPTQLKAAGRTFAGLVAFPWPTFVGAFLLATTVRDEASASIVFSFWYAGCLLYNWLVTISCRNWLRVGLRRRLSEGQFMGAIA